MFFVLIYIFMKYTNDIHSANIVKPKKTISRKFSIQKITYCECGIISENYGNIKDFFYILLPRLSFRYI